MPVSLFGLSKSKEVSVLCEIQVMFRGEQRHVKISPDATEIYIIYILIKCQRRNANAMTSFTTDRHQQGTFD